MSPVSPRESRPSEQTKRADQIAGKRCLEPKADAIVSGIPAPRLWLKVAGLMDSQENLSLVPKCSRTRLKVLR